MEVTSAGYMHMVSRLMSLGRQRCVAALEGGYLLSTISDAAAATVRALLGYTPRRLEDCSPSPRCRASSLTRLRQVGVPNASFTCSCDPDSSAASPCRVCVEGQVAEKQAEFWSNLLTPEWEARFAELMEGAVRKGEENAE